MLHAQEWKLTIINPFLSYTPLCLPHGLSHLLTGSLFTGLFSSSFRGVSSSAPNLRELARSQRKKATSPQRRVSREGMSSVQLRLLPSIKQADQKNTHSFLAIFLIHFYCSWQSMLPNYSCATLLLKTRLSHIQTFVYAQTWLKAAQTFGFLSIPSFFLKPGLCLKLLASADLDLSSLLIFYRLCEC